jgi:hypothetical protein
MSANNKEIVLTDEILKDFKVISARAKFVSLFYMVLIGIFVLFILYRLIMLVSNLGSFNYFSTPLIIGSLISVGIYVFGILIFRYLFIFSKEMKNGVTLQDSNSFSKGIYSLKQHAKSMSLMIIFMMVLVIGVFLFGLLISKF